MSQNGKGSARRPYDKKTWDARFDGIKGLGEKFRNKFPSATEESPKNKNKK